MAPSGQTTTEQEYQQEQRSPLIMKMSTANYKQRSCSLPSWILLVAMVVVTVSGHCSASSLTDEQSSGDSSASSSASSSSSNLSKEEPQLSATAGLVKRSAPVHASSYGHSIMRFGRAPHNIMHFGKRNSQQYQDTQDSAYYNTNQDPLAAESMDSSEQIAASSIPEWILENYLAGKQQQVAAAPSSGSRLLPKILVVQVPVPYAASKVAYGIQKKAATRDGFSEQDMSKFMHFGK